MRIERLCQEFGLDVRWTTFPLHPNTPDDGMSLNDLFAGQMDISAMMNRLRRVATELQLPFGSRTHTYNSRKAQELSKWADEKGAGRAFHQALYRAYFAAGENIARPDVLTAIAATVGLSTDEALQVITEGSYADEVDTDWLRAGQLGVTAVPTLVFNNSQLVGFQPYTHCRDFILEAS